jgi:hypothetical protein
MLDQTDQANWQRLLRRIKDRRRTVDSYLRSARPRAARLTYVSIVSSAVAAALTAGPGFGGEKFVAATSKIVGGEPSDVWQPICLIAAIASIIAAISANLSKAKNAEARIIHAEACNAELEGLQALVEFQQLPLEDAVKLYGQYIASIPFVPETTPSNKRMPSQKRRAGST